MRSIKFDKFSIAFYNLNTPNKRLFGGKDYDDHYVVREAIFLKVASALKTIELLGSNSMTQIDEEWEQALYGNPEAARTHGLFAQAQKVVNGVEPGFDGKMGNTRVQDIRAHTIGTMEVDECGILHLLATLKDGDLIPHDIQAARSLAERRRIRLNPDLALHYIVISSQDEASAHDGTFKPYLGIDYIDFGDHKKIKAFYCCYSEEEDDWISIEELIKTAAGNFEETNIYSIVTAEKRSLPMGAGKLLGIMESLLEKAFRFSLENKPHSPTMRIVKPDPKVVSKSVLELSIKSHRARLIAAARVNEPHEQLAVMTETHQAAEREKIIKHILKKAQENSKHTIEPYTFEDVLACVNPNDLIRALEQIPDPHFCVIKIGESTVLNVSSGRSVTNTLGMTHNEALAWISNAGLQPVSGSLVTRLGSKKDYWTLEGLASKRGFLEGYCHFEIGAHVTTSIPMDLGIVP